MSMTVDMMILWGKMIPNVNEIQYEYCAVELFNRCLINKQR